MEPEGVFNGREAIEKALADLFQRRRPTNFMSEANKLNAIGNGAWAVGQWWCTLESQSGPVPMMGYWSEIYVREGETWQIRVSTFVQAATVVAVTVTQADLAPPLLVTPTQCLDSALAWPLPRPCGYGFC